VRSMNLDHKKQNYLTECEEDRQLSIALFVQLLHTDYQHALASNRRFVRCLGPVDFALGWFPQVFEPRDVVLEEAILMRFLDLV